MLDALQNYFTSINSQTLLESIAFLFGILSVWYARKQELLTYPSGIIATLITVYIMYKANYLADMCINIYYSIMSIYGWYKWKHLNTNPQKNESISKTNSKQKIIGVILFLISGLFCIIIYNLFHVEIKINNWVDILTTSLFFTAMWYMALKKIENWILWIIGDFLLIPILWSRELYIFAIQYVIFTILAILAYIEWKKLLNKTKPIY